MVDLGGSGASGSCRKISTRKMSVARLSRVKLPFGGLLHVIVIPKLDDLEILRSRA